MFDAEFSEALKGRMLQSAQLFIRDDQEVLESAGGSKDLDFVDPIQQHLQLDAVKAGVEPLLEIVEEQRLDRFEDVRHRGVRRPRSDRLPGVTMAWNIDPKMSGLISLQFRTPRRVQQQISGGLSEGRHNMPG